MARTLDVYLHRDLVGHLIQDDGGQMVFDYSKAWIENRLAVPLSHSLPLREERFTRSECRGFFAGLLPEEGKRETIARNLGISSQNDYAMLDQIGGECAGAVAFVPTGEPFPEESYSFRKLNEGGLANILQALPKRPLMAGEEGIRLSLAGAQDKIAVQIKEENIILPSGGAPSTHILKPAIKDYEGTVFNEALCMQLASRIGLPTAKVEIGKVEDIDYLLVERYDRQTVPKGTHPLSGGLFGSPITNYFTRRLHQEDFCQALAVPPDMKYQAEGGPSLKQCFNLLREVSSVPALDLPILLDTVIFNLLIGNNDAHSKNFSLVYREPTGLLDTRATGLAPLYDLICTVYYPELNQKMAMKIGGEYVSEKIYPEHFEALAKEAGMSAKAVVRRVGRWQKKLRKNLEKLSWKIKPRVKSLNS